MKENKREVPVEDDVIDLKEIFWAIRKRLWLVILALVVGMAIGGSYSYFFIKPTYSSTSLIYIDGGGSLSSTISALTELQVGETLTKDYSVIIKSRPVLEEVIDNLGLEISYKQLSGLISVDAVTDTRIIRITVTAGDPQTAMRIVNEIDEVCIWRIQELISSVVPQVVEEGVVEPQKVAPSNSKNALMCGILFALLVIAICVFEVIRDDSLRTNEDIVRYLDLPVLGEVPMKQGAHHKSNRKRGR